MSLHNDPFDLLRTGQNMDNVVPFLSPGKVNQMIDMALTHPQATVKKKNPLQIWKFSGLAAVACMALFMVFLTPESAPLTQTIEFTSAAVSSTEDVGEFGELVMLDTWERY